MYNYGILKVVRLIDWLIDNLYLFGLQENMKSLERKNKKTKNKQKRRKGKQTKEKQHKTIKTIQNKQTKKKKNLSWKGLIRRSNWGCHTLVITLSSSIAI